MGQESCSSSSFSSSSFSFSYPRPSPRAVGTSRAGWGRSVPPDGLHPHPLVEWVAHGCGLLREGCAPPRLGPYVVRAASGGVPSVSPDIYDARMEMSETLRCEGAWAAARYSLKPGPGTFSTSVEFSSSVSSVSSVSSSFSSLSSPSSCAAGTHLHTCACERHVARWADVRRLKAGYDQRCFTGRMPSQMRLAGGL